MLDEVSGAREAARVLGPGATLPAIRWLPLSSGSEAMRLLTIDFGMMAEPSGAAGPGYVAYAILERSGDGGQVPKVSWYHDLGRKLDEQKGAPWSPLGAQLLGSEEESGAGGRSLVVEAAPRGSSSATGLLVLEAKGGAWSAARRIAPGGGARLLGLGPEGVVFIADREPAKGVLAGAPAGTFRALVFHGRQNGVFAKEPVVASIPDVVTATETLIATLRRGDKEGAKRLCASPDVVEAMLYFSPGWKGGGRIVRVGPTTLEILYEETDRPSLRLELTYENRAGVLVLSSATGRAAVEGR